MNRRTFIKKLGSSALLAESLLPLIPATVMGEDNIPVSGTNPARLLNIPLNKISPEGWQRNRLLKQRDGLTGHLDVLCEPFNKGGWRSI